MLAEVWDAINGGDNARARALLEADPALLASDAGQMALGYALAHGGLFAEARAVYTGLRQAHAGGPLEHIHAHQLGMVERLAGDFHAALRLFDHERKLIGTLPPAERPFKRAVNGYELGVCRLALGETEAARVDLVAALADAREAGDPLTLGCVHRALGDLAAGSGDPDSARAEYEQAHADFQEAGDDRAAAEVRARGAVL